MKKLKFEVVPQLVMDDTQLVPGNTIEYTLESEGVVLQRSVFEIALALKAKVLNSLPRHRQMARVYLDGMIKQYQLLGRVA